MGVTVVIVGVLCMTRLINVFNDRPVIRRAMETPRGATAKGRSAVHPGNVL